MQRHYLITLLLIVATAGVYQQVRHHDFVSNWDDQSHIYDNPYLSPVTVPNVLYFWQHPYLGMYRPLTFTAWAAIATVARLPSPRQSAELGTHSLNPHIFHIASLLLHLLNVVLMFTILRLLVSNDWAAGCGALLFGIHPVQVESVAFISGMQNVLTAFFSFLALWQYLRYAQARRESLSRRQQTIHYALATLCFVLALLAKPSAVSVPLMAWALDHWALRRPARQCSLSLLPWIVLTLPFILSTQLVSLETRTPLWGRLIISGDTLAFYGYKLLLPLQLSIDYGRTPQFVLNHWWGYLTWLAPCAIAILIWRNRARHPYLMAAAGIFVAALLPVLGLIPFKFQLFSTVADRYLYLALLGPVLALAWGLDRLWPQQGTYKSYGKGVAAGCALIMMLFGLRSMQQVQYWQNSLTLFENSIRVNPRGWYGYFSLGLILYRQGKTEAAVKRFEETLQIVPNSLPVHTFLGLARLKQKQTEEAISHLRDALKIGPRFPLAHALLGSALDRQGKSTEAALHLRQALRAIPNSPELHVSLGIALDRQGKSAEAVNEFREAWRLRHQHNKLWIAANKGQADYDVGDAARQQRYLQEVITDALATNLHHAPALTHCGAFLARQGKSGEALFFFREALKINPRDVQARYNLARTLAAQGKNAQAAIHYREVLRLQPTFAPARQALLNLTAQKR